MTAITGNRLSKMARAVPPAHEWEMISGFMLNLAGRTAGEQVELLAPIVEALQPYGMHRELLMEISAAVEQAGDELRGCCPDGRLGCVNVRLHMSASSLRTQTTCCRGWGFFVVKNIASSESDNLAMLEDPRCFIDVHIFDE